MAVHSVYGVCKRCDFPFVPVHFIEEERDKQHMKTGRVRRAVSHLLCESCGKQECVDDTFDGQWFTPAKKEKQYVQNRISG